jgi:hypothetical protein
MQQDDRPGGQRRPFGMGMELQKFSGWGVTPLPAAARTEKRALPGNSCGDLKSWDDTNEEKSNNKPG